MESIKDVQKNIKEEFELLDDWMIKYEYIIDLGRKLQPLPDEYKTEQNRVEGCQSKVWVHVYSKDSLIFIEADSDALIVKGLLALLIRMFSGRQADEIRGADLQVFDDIGLTKHLSPARTNGLYAVISYIKNYVETVK